ncbi:putative cyclin-D7-1 [Acorus gramineus]|uniref:Cyclin-D7-1 n=1 Tax=Acorus gramineus TaxID=55184 RepID=A0AAV9B4Z0_ACOGR|nr:putative cyclin-D7-1 [Acorus gramineus]
MRLFHEWENWMIELISIACLSIAAKYDEVFFPSLIEIQSEDLDHSFESNTIQRMEMAVLEALDWRLSPVTAHSYVEPLTDPKFLEFRPSIVAVSALRCALQELTSSKCNEYATRVANFDSQEHKEMLEKCHKAMDERLIDPQDSAHNSHHRPSSPITVIPSQRTVISDGCIDFHVLFEASNKKRKMDGTGGSF